MLCHQYQRLNKFIGSKPKILLKFDFKPPNFLEFNNEFAKMRIKLIYLVY